MLKCSIDGLLYFIFLLLKTYFPCYFAHVLPIKLNKFYLFTFTNTIRKLMHMKQWTSIFYKFEVEIRIEKLTFNKISSCDQRKGYFLDFLSFVQVGF